MSLETGLINPLQRASSDTLSVLPCRSGKKRSLTLSIQFTPVCSNPDRQLQRIFSRIGNWQPSRISWQVLYELWGATWGSSGSFAPLNRNARTRKAQDAIPQALGNALLFKVLFGGVGVRREERGWGKRLSSNLKNYWFNQISKFGGSEAYCTDMRCQLQTTPTALGVECSAICYAKITAFH